MQNKRRKIHMPSVRVYRALKVMAKVILNIKALPKDPSQDIPALSQSVKNFLSKYGVVYKMDVQPLAFGLNVINVTLVTEESEGTSKIEAAFQVFKEAELSITDVSRMLEG